MPQTFSRSVRFQFQIDSLHAGQNRPILTRGKIQLAWYGHDVPALRFGDKWRLVVRLKRPHGLANPGGFDFERWWFRNGIMARGYVREQPKPIMIKQADRYPVGQMRQAVAESFERVLAASPYTGILTALAVGDRQRISRDQWQVFSRTGTGHLMAISGLHVGLTAGLVFLLVRNLWVWLPVAGRYLPAPKAGAIAGFWSATGYALMAGFSLPTQRALIMVAVVTLAVLWQRPIVPSRVLAIALLTVLVWDPGAPLSVGFWFSFVAVAMIFYTVRSQRDKVLPIRRWLQLQITITVAMLPCTLIAFQSASLLSPLANLIAIPWVSVTVVPVTLSAGLAGYLNDWLQMVLLNIAAVAMDWLWQFLVLLAEAPWSVMSAPSPPVWTLVFAVPGVLLLVAPWGVPGRYLGVLLCLPLLYFPAAKPRPGDFWFTLLEVDQGLALVVRTTHHTLVYDTGPRLGRRSDAGSMVLVPFLRQQGVDAVDALILSHADRQHTAGTRSLLERFDVDAVLTAEPLKVPVRDATACRRGRMWVWDDVKFHILHPPRDIRFGADDASCVLLVEGKGGRLLLPGDIEPSAQGALVRAFGDSLRADVLVAPHQGSRNLGLQAFVAAVRPRYILFSTGYRNRFGHPKPETVRFYSQFGARVLNTVHCGAISFRLQRGEALSAECFRDRYHRHWHVF